MTYLRPGTRVYVICEGAVGRVLTAAFPRYYVAFDGDQADLEQWFGGDSDPRGWYSWEDLRPVSQKRKRPHVP